MEAYLSYVSLIGAALSTSATGYFWFVRMRQEKPCLALERLDHEFFLGNSSDQQRHLGLKLGLIVANYSILPNAVLGCRLWLKSAEGAWQELHSVSLDKQTPLPLNVPSLQTVLLRIQGTAAFPYTAELEEGNKTVGNYLNRFGATPRTAKVEVRGLSGWTRAEEIALW